MTEFDRSYLNFGEMQEDENDARRGMTPLTREDIQSLFTKKQRKELRLPNIDSINWENVDFLGWRHPSGHLSYVVYEYRNDLKAVVLEPTRQSRISRIMNCSWCVTSQPGDGITLYTTPLPHDDKVTVGDYICSDLQCSLYVRGKKSPSVPRITENLSIEGRIDRLVLNVDRFFDRLYPEELE